MADVLPGASSIGTGHRIPNNQEIEMSEIHIESQTGRVSQATIQQRVDRRIVALGDRWALHPRHAPEKRHTETAMQAFLDRQRLRLLSAQQ